MNRQLATFAALLLASLLTGCATHREMAFQKDADHLATSKPVVLMTVTLRNTYKTSYQPRLWLMRVTKYGPHEELNFVMDDKGKTETDTVEEGNSYLVRMELDAGTYEIRGANARADQFPIHTFFFAPMHSPLELKGPGVYYLGHVNATIRERKDNEFKAGASNRPVDQSVGGATGGTFDVEITDRFAADEAAFRAKFPQLAGVPIQKAILPPFDRVKAQHWWEDHTEIVIY